MLAINKWNSIIRCNMAVGRCALNNSMANIRSDIVDCRNEAGHGWKLYRLDGAIQLYQEHRTREEDIEDIRRVQDFQLRNDDIFIAAYPKCGTHWLWEIVTMILHGSAEYSPAHKEFTMLENTKFGRAAEMSSPRVLNSHKYFRHLPSKLVEKKIKVIHIMRNPKDVSVSFYHHLSGIPAPRGFEGTYAEFAELFMYGKVPSGSYFDYLKDWKGVEKIHADFPILNIFYEDLKMKPVEVIRRLSEFLDKPTSHGLCEKIADASSFEKLKKAQQTSKQGTAELDKRFKEGFHGLYRKGQIGDWRNWLTVAQNEAFDDVIGKEMKNTGIEFKY